MAVFVLLAAAAGTWIVATDLGRPLMVAWARLKDVVDGTAQEVVDVLFEGFPRYFYHVTHVFYQTLGDIHLVYQLLHLLVSAQVGGGPDVVFDLELTDGLLHVLLIAHDLSLKGIELCTVHLSRELAVKLLFDAVDRLIATVGDLVDNLVHRRCTYIYADLSSRMLQGLFYIGSKEVVEFVDEVEVGLVIECVLPGNNEIGLLELIEHLDALNSGIASLTLLQDLVDIAEGFCRESLKDFSRMVPDVFSIAVYYLCLAGLTCEAHAQHAEAFLQVGYRIYRE